MDLSIPLKRSSRIIGFYGPPSSGKTIAISYFALLFFLNGKEIVSNYHLVIPHTFIDSLVVLDACVNSMVVLDDIEFWASSKFLKSDEKKDLLQISLMFSKRGINPVLYSIKRPLECDKTLRALTDTFVRCSLELKFIPGSLDEYDYYSGFLDAHRIRMEVYDVFSGMSLVNVVYLDDLDLYCNLYDTQEEIKHLGVSASDFKGGQGKKNTDLGFSSDLNLLQKHKKILDSGFF